MHVLGAAHPKSLGNLVAALLVVIGLGIVEKTTMTLLDTRGPRASLHVKVRS